MTEANQRPPQTARRSAVALIMALAALAVFHTVYAWQSAGDLAERLLGSQTRIMEYQCDTSLRAIDTLLQEAAQRISPETWPDPTLIQTFENRLMGFPEITGMLVIRADGRTAGRGIGSLGSNPTTLDLSDREYFRFHLDHPGHHDLHIGDPILARTDGRQGIPLSRGIVNAQGRFLGVVMVTLDPNFFLRAFERLMVEDAGGISLIRRDGIFLARLPDPQGSFGRSTAASPLFTTFLPHAADGFGRFTSVTDGNTKIVGYRTLERYPLVATIGMSERTAYAKFWLEAWGIALALVAVSLGLYRLAHQSDHREQAKADLVQRLDEQSRSLELQVEERTRHLEKARAESERRAAQLAASNADLEQFAYIASHDLQEPLRTITSFVQLLQHRYGDKLDADAREYIHFAVDGAMRMHTLILDLLAYARISTQVEAFTLTELVPVVSDAMDNLEAAIAEAGATVTVHPLPAIETDRPQMISVFQNLIANATKYRKPDLAPVIDISAVAKDGEWEFRVKDNGIGIAPQYKDRIFVIFQRLHTASEYQGTGIGLAICKRIVERHGGHIRVESQAGAGATFVFTLPATQPKD